MENFSELISKINSYVWGIPMLVLLFGTHIFLTLRLGFIQKHTVKAIKLSVSKSSGSEGEMSRFASLATSLAATIGTGNIIGISTAVALGGPGAIFWCWLTGIFGMATSYAECYIGAKYRTKTVDGGYIGGAMYTLTHVLKLKPLGILFCICTILVSVGVGSSVQSNSIAMTAKAMWNISPYTVGFITAILSGLVIIGGVKKISKLCMALVPSMGLFYMVGCFLILIMNRDFLWESVVVIVKYAFLPNSVAGGFIGSTILTAARFGIVRGLFTNEAGLGSAPIAAAAAQVDNPVKQALVSMTATFWDTVVMCAVTGIVIVSNIVRYPSSVQNLSSGELTAAAFAQIPVIGPYILSISLTAFAFATIIGWAFFGERAVVYMYGIKGLTPYKVSYIVMTFVGAVISLDLIWEISDILNALMTLPNLISVLLLSNIVAKDTKSYLNCNNSM